MASKDKANSTCCIQNVIKNLVEGRGVTPSFLMNPYCTSKPPHDFYELFAIEVAEHYDQESSQ